MAPAVAEPVTGVPAVDIEATARTLWESRPVAFYAWSGIEQHSNATQTVRAINQLYALTGSFDAPGGNVLFPSVPTNTIEGVELLAPEQLPKAIGVAGRPLGPARFEFVTGEDMYTAALEGHPYRLRGLVNFGANLVMAHGDSARGRDALVALDFMVHADLFLNPTADQADVVLPVASASRPRDSGSSSRSTKRRSRWCSCGPRSRRRAARRARTCRSSSRSRHAWGWASTSGTATSTPRGATSSRRAV